MIAPVGLHFVDRGWFNYYPPARPEDERLFMKSAIAGVERTAGKSASIRELEVSLGRLVKRWQKSKKRLTCHQIP